MILSFLLEVENTKMHIEYEIDLIDLIPKNINVDTW